MTAEVSTVFIANLLSPYAVLGVSFLNRGKLFGVRVI